MAKYHTMTINGMNYERYAYHLVVDQEMGIADAAEEMEFEFNMPESAAKTLVKHIAWNTGGRRDEIASAIAAEQEAEQLANTPWQQHPATEKQLHYLTQLNVNVTRPLTKGEASQIIDAVKSGEGVGQFSLYFFDGSN